MFGPRGKERREEISERLNMKRTGGGEGDGGGGGVDGLTHSSSQNNRCWPKQLRTEQVSFLPPLLCAPAGASHGAACDGQQQHYRSCEDARAPSAGLTENHSQELHKRTQVSHTHILE